MKLYTWNTSRMINKEDSHERHWWPGCQCKIQEQRDMNKKIFQLCVHGALRKCLLSSRSTDYMATSNAPPDHQEAPVDHTIVWMYSVGKLHRTFSKWLRVYRYLQTAGVTYPTIYTLTCTKNEKNNELHNSGKDGTNNWHGRVKMTHFNFNRLLSWNNINKYCSGR